MIEFKQKEYTIQEGHYTGPKDMEKIPSTIEVLGKSVLGGSGVGAVAGGILKETGTLESTGVVEGLKTGGKLGFFTGIIMKVLLNHLHKPMSKIKYQEVDKMIRREFGMNRVAGITWGDSREARKTYDDKFGTNDREVTSYKINFCIHNNQVTMYTLRISDEELDKLNKSLDYYCKKYSGMEYSSRPINARFNTYSVNITFTNYEAISSFILEVSSELGCKINLMNNSALMETRISDDESYDEAEQHIYSSLPRLSKYDIKQILSKGVTKLSNPSLQGPRERYSVFVNQTVKAALELLRDKEIAVLGSPLGVKRADFDNHYLESVLQKCGFIEGMQYTVAEENEPVNISIYRGVIIITANTHTQEEKVLDKILGDNDKFSKTEVNGKATLWTGLLDNRGAFEVLIRKIVGSLKINIYNG